MLAYSDLYSGFYNLLNNSKNFSEDLNIVSQKWTEIFKNFYIHQISPIPGTTNPNLFASLENFKSGFQNSIKTRTIKYNLEILVQNLHLGVCQGINMSGIYSTPPPSMILELKSCFNEKYSITIIANLLSTKIFNYVLSTFSIQNSSGAIIKWM